MKLLDKRKGDSGDGSASMPTVDIASTGVTNYHEAAFLVLVGFSLLILLARTIADPDLWGHLRFGLDILSKGRVAQVDPYSFLTAGQRWINHEWLAEVAFAAAWIAGGEPGLVILKTVVGLLTFGLLFWHLRAQNIAPLRSAILLLIFALAILPFLQIIRPQMFTYLFFAIFLIIIYQAEKGKYVWLWGTIPLMALWANVHGGFLAAAAILVGWSALHLLSHRMAWKQVLTPALLALIAVTINPYGKDLITFLLRTATVPRPEIDDWEPLRLISADGAAYLIILAVSITGIIMSKRSKNLALIAIFLVMTLLPLTATRHLPLFSIAALVISAEHLGSSFERFSSSKALTSSQSWVLVAIPLLCVALLAILAFSLHLEHIHGKVGEYPIGAVDLLRKSQISGNIANEFNWGEYLIWHLGPKIKVSMDGRRETIYSNLIYKDNLNFMRGADNWDALLKQHPTDLALIYKTHSIYNLLLKDPGWTLIYEDKISALFAARNSPVLIPLQRAASDFDPQTQTYEDHFP